jgi:hypothetical protein
LAAILRRASAAKIVQICLQDFADLPRPPTETPKAIHTGYQPLLSTLAIHREIRMFGLHPAHAIHPTIHPGYPPSYPPRLSTRLSTHAIHPCYPPRLSTPAIHPGYPPRLSTPAIHPGYPPSYPPRLSTRLSTHAIHPAIHPGYPPRLSTHAIHPGCPPRYPPLPLRLSTPAIHPGYPPRYPPRLSTRLSTPLSTPPSRSAKIGSIGTMWDLRDQSETTRSYLHPGYPPTLSTPAIHPCLGRTNVLISRAGARSGLFWLQSFGELPPPK